MNTNSITISICNHINDAPNYNTDGRGVKGAEIVEAVIVRNGTVEGNDTVDLVFKDQDGNKYVALVTGRILKTVTDLVNK